MIRTYTDGSPILDTKIPEGRKVEGLEYGAHVSLIGRCGYYVSLDGKWGIAILTPADDELVGDDADIVEAIREELEG